MPTTNTDSRTYVRLRLVLQAGLAEMFTLADELVAKLKGYNKDEAEKISGEASKAFEALYIKSGAILGAVTSAKSISSNVADGHLSTPVSHFRYSLDALGGSFRESQAIVIGKRALADDQRREDAIALLQDMKETLAEQAKEHFSKGAYNRADLKKYT